MVKVKSKKDCKFGYKGEMFIFKYGEEREINVPLEKIDMNSFEVIDNPKEIKVKKKKEFNEVNKMEVKNMRSGVDEK